MARAVEDTPNLLGCNKKRRTSVRRQSFRDTFSEVLRPMSVTYTATLPVRDQTVLFLSSLLHSERLRRGTRAHTRALGCFKQAVLVLRWFLDNTRLTQLAGDNAIA